MIRAVIGFTVVAVLVALAPREVQSQGTGTSAGSFVVSMSATPSPVVQGATIIYTVNINNLGAPTTGAVLTDTLPAGITFLSASAPSGWSCGAASGQIVCNGFAVSSGSSPITLVAMVSDCQSPKTNTARLSPSSLL